MVPISSICCDQGHDRNIFFQSLNITWDINMILNNSKINLQHFKPFENQKIWAISNADKIPIQANSYPARVNDPSSWMPLKEVLEYTSINENCLPAIILNDQLDLIFIDLDNVIDPQTKTIEAWAQELIDICDSFTEVSKSGKGIHIFLRGNPPILAANEQLRCRPPKTAWDKSGELELYFTKKAATVTGNTLLDKPIRNIDKKELLILYRRFFPENTDSNLTKSIALSPTMSDEKIIELARTGKNQNKFIKLFDYAEWDAGNDRSAMDLSLANFLAFYTQDINQVKRLMMSSSLYRDKWERVDYLQRTIETAINSLRNTYRSPNNQETFTPLPIKTTTKTTGEPFPVSCLPPILSNMAKEMQRVTKTPMELCCAGVLSAASIATKGTVKVYEKADLTHFTCFFFMIIAESGERKSNVMKKAIAPIYTQQEDDKERYLNDRRIYSARQKTAKHEEKQVLASKTKSFNEKAEQIELIQKELESYKPKPYRYITDDFTNSALFKLLDENNGSFAVTSLDGGNVLDYIQGNGPGTDGSLNDSLILKATWGDSISRDRTGKTEEGEHLFIKDPACHVSITVQPDRCRKFLADPRLRGSGMIARVMPIPCTSTIGTRFEEENEPVYTIETVETYNTLINSLFKNDLLIEVHLTKEASSARRNYFNEIEREMREGFSLEDLRDLGSKAATQVTRLAALFELCKSKLTSKKVKVSENTWFEAEAVGRWILDQAANLQRTDYDELVLIAAKIISEKLPDSNLINKPFFSKRDFQQRFKKEIGKSARNQMVDDILSTLISYQWIAEIPRSNQNWRTPRYKVNQKGGF